MYLPILIPSVCVGALLSLALLVYSCWKTFHSSPRSPPARERCTELVKTAYSGIDSQSRVVSFAWYNLQITLKGGARRVVIHGSCGRATSKELTAIIGPSGMAHLHSAEHRRA